MKNELAIFALMTCVFFLSRAPAKAAESYLEASGHEESVRWNDVDGIWLCASNNLYVSITSVEYTLTYWVPASGVTYGSLLSCREVSGFGLTGTLSDDRQVIYWSNGDRYFRITPSNLSGRWRDKLNGREVFITQDGLNLAFNVPTTGELVAGALLTPTLLNGWGLTGTLTANGTTINWSNGDSYFRY